MEPVELVAIVAAMVAGAFIKSITGMGLPPVAIPVLAQVVGVEDAIVIMAIPTLATNGWLVWRHRSAFGENPNLPLLAATSVVGGVLGAWLLVRLDERVVAAILAVAVLAYVAKLVHDPGVRMGERLARRIAAPVGLLGGALQGATGLSGPVLSTYLHAQRLTRPVFVLSVAVLFQVSAIGQVAGLVGVGRYTGELLAQSLLATAVVTVVLAVGGRFADRLPHRVFDSLVIGVLVISALKLLYDAFA